MPRCLMASLFASAVLAQDPAPDQFARDLETIVPVEAERRWQEIPWRSELGGALVEASDAGKPVLLWAMNGHPLGQT